MTAPNAWNTRLPDPYWADLARRRDRGLARQRGEIHPNDRPRARSITEIARGHGFKTGDDFAQAVGLPTDADVGLRNPEPPTPKPEPEPARVHTMPRPERRWVPNLERGYQVGGPRADDLIPEPQPGIEVFSDEQLDAWARQTPYERGAPLKDR